MKKGLLLAASFAMMGSMGSAHAMQPMSGDELRDVSGQALVYRITLQRPITLEDFKPRKVKIRDFFPSFKLNVVPPIIITKANT